MEHLDPLRKVTVDPMAATIFSALVSAPQRMPFFVTVRAQILKAHTPVLQTI